MNTHIILCVREYTCVFVNTQKFLIHCNILIELTGLLWILLCAILNTEYTKSVIISTEIKMMFPNCTGHSNLYEFYFYPFSIIMFNTQILLCMSLFTLLSILTRYLSARYLNHSFKKTLTKYLSWLGFHSHYSCVF